MLSEALDVIAALFEAKDEAISWHGDFFDLETARLWDLPEQRVPIGVAVSGAESCALAGRKADLMVAVEPKPELGEMFDAAGGAGKGRVGQIAVSYDEDRDLALRRAHEQFRWFGLGWKVMADLPNPDGFEAAAQFVTPDDVARSIPCGPDVDEHVEKIKPFVDAGFTEVALVQIGGGEQEKFTAWAERELLPALRDL
jgi:G6PDH family F420-dependent oxidoreductase